MRKPRSHSRYAVAESLSFWSVLRNMVRAEYGTWNNYAKKEHHLGNARENVIFL